MAKIIEVMPHLHFVADKITGIDIDGEEQDVVRVFGVTYNNGYYIRCADQETAQRVYSDILKQLNEI